MTDDYSYILNNNKMADEEDGNDCKIVLIGEKYSETEADKEYYKDLALKLNQGISLLQREPVTDDSVGIC